MSNERLLNLEENSEFSSHLYFEESLLQKFRRKLVLSLIFLEDVFFDEFMHVLKFSLFSS
jgi:hypothetical protein